MRSSVKWVVKASDKAQLASLGNSVGHAVRRMMVHLDKEFVESEDGHNSDDEVVTIPLTPALRERLGITVRTKANMQFTQFEARTLNSASGLLETRAFRMARRLKVSLVYSCV